MQAQKTANMDTENSYFPRQMRSLVPHLIIINALFWLASTILPQKFGIDLVQVLGLHYWQASNFHVWQLLTYMFMHDTTSIWHLFFNMFSLFIFGRIVEQVWGSKRFLFYYMVCGLGAGLVQELTWMIDLNGVLKAFDSSITVGSAVGQEDIFGRYFSTTDWSSVSTGELMRARSVLLNKFITIGASGAIFGLLLAFGWLFPDEKLFIMFIPIPIKARWFVPVYAIIELVAGVSNFSFDNVAHFAHLGGMLFGLLLLLYWRHRGTLYLSQES